MEPFWAIPDLPPCLGPGFFFLFFIFFLTPYPTVTLGSTPWIGSGRSYYGSSKCKEPDRKLPVMWGVWGNACFARCLALSTTRQPCLLALLCGCWAIGDAVLCCQGRAGLQVGLEAA